MPTTFVHTGRDFMTDEPMSSDPISDPATTPSESKPRVLIVDDDPDIIESIRFALKSKAVEIMIARDGNQGLAMAEKEEPDLVILDSFLALIRKGLISPHRGVR